MTLKEFIDSNGFPEVKKFGKVNGITYYIEKDLSDDMEMGVPFIVQEESGNFSVCTSDESLTVISMFGDDTV